MLKRATAVLAAVMATVLFTVSASAYTLAGDFRPYADRDLTTAETLPPNEPLPVETADGIQITSDKSGSGLFSNKHTGVTLTKKKVKINGFTCTFRVDSMDEGTSYPALVIGFTQNPGMFTWNVDMEGETMGNEGIALFYRFRDGAEKDPYFEYNVAQTGKNIKAAGQSHSFQDKSIEVGSTITLKFEENATYGYLVWANGVMLRVPETDTPANLKGLRKVADSYNGELYFNFATQTQSIFGEQIKATLMFVNGEKVSSKQTNKEPVHTYEQLKDGKIVPGTADTTSSKTESTPSNNSTTTPSKPNTTTSTEKPTESIDSTSSTDSLVDVSSELTDDTSSDEDVSEVSDNTAIASNQDKGNSNTGLIIAIVVVAILVLGGGVTAAILILKGKK